MKNFLTTLVLFLTVGLAVWAYSEINTTKVTLDRVNKLNRDITVAKSRLRKLNAEWAYQNRPERLETLALIHFDDLELVTLTKDHFAGIDDIRRTAPAAPFVPQLTAITDPVEVMDRGATQ